MIIEPSGADDVLFHDAMKSIKYIDTVHPKDYRDCVIMKPWGHEFEMFDDEKHAVWMLNLRPNRATSMHCHQRKSATLVPLTGNITVITTGDPLIVQPLQSITFMPKAFHCLWNNGPSDVRVIEIETPSEKLDLIRVHDAYGRAGMGYEGETYIVRENLDRYGYSRISDNGTANVFDHDISIDQEGVKIRKMINA